MSIMSGESSIRSFMEGNKKNRLYQVDDSMTISFTPIRPNFNIWTRPEDPEMQLICHWLRLDDQNLTLCLKSSVAYSEHCESNNFQNDIVRRAIELAMKTRSRGIYISTMSVLLPCGIDAACIPPDEALSVHYTPPPDTPSPPIFPLSAMKMMHIPGLGGAVSVMEVDKSQLVYKQLVLASECEKDIELERLRRDTLQSELDVYIRLHGSPYVLPIVGLVGRVRHFIVCDDPYVKDVLVIDGFLIPFVGMFSPWCLGFRAEWTMPEKEFLALTLMGAMLDFEQHGVYTTDLKCPNILLTTVGLKIIDSDLQTHTPGFSRWGVEGGNAVQALYNMSQSRNFLVWYNIHNPL
ncbi:uncharacterized protein EV420DRAFT_1485803 [Desarmillaria tabescens]|uniref:Protein kinase domain-containing protein n=1 Tax=Armillaria tabescens TaxID=1929756 RepID=A0AA39MNZ6_ARMTA|nr:uncharacterized protein EV420DRAFT_1485803 [Desarmillaria tabescens]KAK0440958.1 hypothetical protein EV420DRAFT_1485803 [Desarmillaria tabescens]